VSSKVGRNGRGTPACADSLGPNAIVIEALLAQAPCETFLHEIINCERRDLGSGRPTERDQSA